MGCQGRGRKLEPRRERVKQHVENYAKREGVAIKDTYTQGEGEEDTRVDVRDGEWTNRSREIGSAGKGGKNII